MRVDGGMIRRAAAGRATASVAGLLLIAGCNGEAPQRSPSAASAAGGFKLGVNLTTVSYYSGEPTLANLLTGGKWNVVGADIRTDPVNGILVPKGQSARRYLTTPAPIFAGQPAKVVCTWEGTADVTLAGRGVMTDKTSRSVAINWTPMTATDRGGLVWMDVFSTGAEGARNFDCRVSTLPRDAALSPEVVDSLKPFKVLRFLDWSNVNGNPTNVTWANRTQPDALDQSEGAPLGVAIEHQVALARATGAAPWFNVPWNADEDYQRRMAKLVHDSLPADREVYVELSNEVWNEIFGAAGQARREGLAEGLATGGAEAGQLRYAEKVRWMMNIWSQVFADRPGKLVRVGATLAAAPGVGERQLGEGRMAEAIDAIAIAPYFGGGLLTADAASVDPAALLTRLRADAEAVVANQVAAYRALADRYGKRLIAYEAGQHLTGGGAREVASRTVNRAPGMYDIYRDYIGGWRAQVGDTMVLYNSTSPISQYGAWGLQEYVGQPLADAPKRRAALSFTR